MNEQTFAANVYWEMKLFHALMKKLFLEIPYRGMLIWNWEVIIMEQITLNVQGMSCGHCVNSIEGSLGKLNGVKSVKVHLDDGTVDVGFDSNTVTLETIKNEIEDQGYDVAA